MWDLSHEDRIRRLEEELYRTRYAVVTLLPRAIQEIAKDYHNITTRTEAHNWLERLVEAVIELAWPIAEANSYSGRRADCPLCKRGTLGPYAEGFLLPGGLRKHLLGEGNAYPCEVLTPVRELAADYWQPRVLEVEAREKAARETEKEERRQREDVFQTDPRSKPQLRDESLWGAEPRDDESLAWAIERLRQLGFAEQRDGRVLQFTKDYGEIIVYADPREEGRLNFSVFRREQTAIPKSRRRWTPDHAGFHLLDSWRKDLTKKVDERVQGARQSLTGGE